MWRRAPLFSADPELQVAQERRAQLFADAHQPLDFSVSSLAVLESVLRNESPDAVDGSGAYLGEVLRRATASGWWAVEEGDGENLIVRWDRPEPWIPRPRVLHAEYLIGTLVRSFMTGGPPESIADHARAWIAYIRLPSDPNIKALGPRTTQKVPRWSWFRRRSP